MSWQRKTCGRSSANLEFSIANLTSRLTEGGKQFEYRMVIRSQDRRNAEMLSRHLRDLPEVIEFRISPTGD
jgi:putative Mg2+ transporter-C (MgtC) family protein